jgi:hypothetical protein
MIWSIAFRKSMLRLEANRRRDPSLNIDPNPTMTENATRDIVAKLWNLCHILRDDGVTYNEYVTELTFLLFLKMMQETGHEDRIPNGYGWESLSRREGLDQLEYYRRLLLDLGDTKKTQDPTILAIFADAGTKLRKPANLKSPDRPSTASTGSRRARRASATSTRACWRRTPPTRNPARASISRPVR